ncbi:chromosome segregation protein SMC, partial [Microbacterium sp. ZXX196]|nr:chromosome segregation protein SMC [Microbacterium sp. ZXX196]
AEAQAAERALEDVRAAHRAAEREADGLRATERALGAALDLENVAADIVARGSAGIRGLVSEAMQVEPGYERAIESALGPLAEGVLAEDADAAYAVAADVGDAGVVDVAIAAAGPSAPGALPAGARAACDVVAAPDGILALLDGVAIADNLAAARALAAAAPAPRAIVTLAGEVVTAFTIRAGSGGGRSRLALQAERDGAATR